MAEPGQTWDGGLTVSARADGTDSYDFGTRAAAVTSLKSGLRLPDMTPLPSPWTLEIEPTLLCNARCHFCSYEDLITDFRERQRALPVIQRTRGLAWETVRRLLADIRDCGTTRGIFWSGGGEPLVWPHLTDAIIASSQFADVSLQTNGITLHRLMTGPRAPRAPITVNPARNARSDSATNSGRKSAATHRTRTQTRTPVLRPRAHRNPRPDPAHPALLQRHRRALRLR
jgi:hypothetical protein